MTLAAAQVLAAYLLGSVPFAYIVVRLRTGRDLRDLGSGNAGATNAMRSAGIAMGLVALVLDLSKGAVAVLSSRALGAGPETVALVAAAAVLGHVYPVFLGFRGGKGVATAAGALGVLAPLPAAFSALVFFVVVAWKRYVSLASVVAVSTFPAFVALIGPAGWTADYTPTFVIACALVPALVVFKHRDNLKRLMEGVERRLGDEEVGK